MKDQKTVIAKLKKEVAPFEVIDTKASIIQIINTLVPLDRKSTRLNSSH